MSDERLERALDDCLRALRRGVSLDQCLAPYADLRPQLQPLLATATQMWPGPVVGLPERRHAAVRTELMSTIAAEPRRRRQPVVALPLPFTRRASARPLAFASVALAAVVAVLMLASSVMLRGPSSSEAVTVLTILQGDVRVEASDGSVRTGANGMRIRPGDSIITSPGGRAVLTFFDGSTVTLDSDTVVFVRSLRERDGRLEAHLVQARGSTWTHVPAELNTARIEIDTPTARVETNDASFATTVQASGGTQVGSQSGDLRVSSGDQRAAVQGGQQTAVDSPGVVVPASTTNLPDKELVLRIRGPVYAFLTDPNGATIGTLDPGVPVNQVPGATATREGDTLVVRIPNPGDGQYALGLRSAGDGQVTVVAEVRNGTVETTSTSFAVTSSETLTSGLQLSGDELALSDVSRTTDYVRARARDGAGQGGREGDSEVEPGAGPDVHAGAPDRDADAHACPADVDARAPDLHADARAHQDARRHKADRNANPAPADRSHAREGQGSARGHVRCVVRRRERGREPHGAVGGSVGRRPTGSAARRKQESALERRDTALAPFQQRPSSTRAWSARPSHRVSC